MKSFGYHIPTRVLFGWGRIAELGQAAAGYGRRAFLMTGKSSARKTGSLDKAVDSLNKARIETLLFEGVEEDPSLDTVERGITMFRGEGCDMVVSLGGGSAIDAAKAVAAGVRHTGPASEIIGVNNVPMPAVPHIAVTTTSGTGSEVTKYAIITDHEAHAKNAISSEYIYPQVAIVDPELTASMPPTITANTGMDALSHAIEGYVSRNSTPVSDALALDSMSFVALYMVRAFRSPDDREAREGIALASMLAGMVITHAGVGLMHGMGYPVTLDFHKAHGLANTLLMGAVMDFSLDAMPEKFAMIAAALGRDISGMPAMTAAKESVAAVRDLAEQLDMDSDPSGLDMTADMLEQNVQTILNNKRIMANVPKAPKRQDLLNIYSWK